MERYVQGALQGRFDTVDSTFRELRTYEPPRAGGRRAACTRGGPAEACWLELEAYQRMPSDTKAPLGGAGQVLAIPLLLFGLGGAAWYEYDMQMSWFAHHPASMLVAFVALGGNAALIKKKGGYANTKMHGNMLSLALGVALFGEPFLPLLRLLRSRAAQTPKLPAVVTRQNCTCVCVASSAVLELTTHVLHATLQATMLSTLTRR